MPLTSPVRRRRDAPHVAAAGFELRLRRWLAAAASHDLDHAADRIRSIERALRAAQHLDAINILQRHLREIEAAAERIGANAVDENQRVVGFTTAREERRHRSGTAVLLQREARHRTKRGRQRELLLGVDVASVDHGDTVRRARQRLIDLRRRDDQRLVEGAEVQRNVQRRSPRRTSIA